MKSPCRTCERWSWRICRKDSLKKIGNSMPGYVVPFSLIQMANTVNLPFMNLASQKNFIALYHMGLNTDKEFLQWFSETYPQNSKRKLDIRKSCIRFKKMDDIPMESIGKLASGMNLQEWTSLHEENVKR